MIIQGQRYVIDDIYMSKGGVTLIFRVPGPRAALPEGTALTVFGRDGVGCWQGTVRGELLLEIPEGAVWTSQYTMTIYKVGH